MILDDGSARRLAHVLGLPVIGTLGVMLAAKRRGFIERVQPCLDDLRSRRFLMTPKLYERILQFAREADK